MAHFPFVDPAVRLNGEYGPGPGESQWGRRQKGACGGLGLCDMLKQEQALRLMSRIYAASLDRIKAHTPAIVAALASPDLPGVSPKFAARLSAEDLEDIKAGDIPVKTVQALEAAAIAREAVAEARLQKSSRLLAATVTRSP